MTTTNELADKILALLEGKTYGEADAALQIASTYLANRAKDVIMSATVAVAETKSTWTPPRANGFYSVK